MQARVTGNHLIPGFSGATFEAQLRDAREHLADIQQRLEDSDGEERAFYKEVLQRLLERLGVAGRPETPAQKLELLAFQQEVRVALREV